MMKTETSAGVESRTARNDVRSEKTAGSSYTVYRVHCPDCGHSKQCNKHADAATRQRKTPCPNCDRMMGVTKLERPGDSAECRLASQAVADALDAQRSVSSDDIPSVNAILEVMGRNPDGYPFDGGPTDLTANQAARALVEGGAL